jgi:hypothetical protein
LDNDLDRLVQLAVAGHDRNPGRGLAGQGASLFSGWMARRLCGRESRGGSGGGGAAGCDQQVEGGLSEDSTYMHAYIDVGRAEALGRWGVSDRHTCAQRGEGQTQVGGRRCEARGRHRSEAGGVRRGAGL